MSESTYKQTIEIDVPKGAKVWKTYPAITIDGSGVMVLFQPAKPLLVNGEPSDWPEWLTANYVAKDEDGSVWSHLKRPLLSAGVWACQSSGSSFLSSAVAIDIPGPWEESLRENPKRKK